MLILDNVSKLETDFIDVPVQSLLISAPQLFSYLAGVMAGLLLDSPRYDSATLHRILRCGWLRLTG